MRKALNELDADQREALLCVADFATALCSSALIVSILQFIGGLVS
jgi:hypothetical protein